LPKLNSRKVECGHSESKHYAHGMCVKCYRKRQTESGLSAERARKFRASEQYLSKKDLILESQRARSAERYATEEGREKQRNHELQKKYGISVEQYEQMLASQNGVCLICGKGETHTRNGKVTLLCVDHCHKTGKVRGLLCKRCNVMLGQSGDDIETLTSAIEYLKRYS
jgi:hypothetical protein